MATGIVKWFNATKGFGFIQPNDGSQDVFLHISALQRAGMAEVAEGDTLNFDVEAGNNGKSQAANISRA